jgi:hypothetical protein
MTRAATMQYDAAALVRGKHDAMQRLFIGAHLSSRHCPQHARADPNTRRHVHTRGFTVEERRRFLRKDLDDAIGYEQRAEEIRRSNRSHAPSAPLPTGPPETTGAAMGGNFGGLERNPRLRLLPRARWRAPGTHCAERTECLPSSACPSCHQPPGDPTEEM